MTELSDIASFSEASKSMFGEAYSRSSTQEAFFFTQFFGSFYICTISEIINLRQTVRSLAKNVYDLTLPNFLDFAYKFKSIIDCRFLYKMFAREKSVETNSIPDRNCKFSYANVLMLIF